MLVTKNWCEQNKISMEFLIEAFNEAEQNEPVTVDEVICKKYIELQNVKKIAKWLNEEGNRLSDGTKYDGQDVSEIIKKSDNHFSRLAKSLFNYNNKLVNGNMSISTLVKEIMQL